MNLSDFDFDLPEDLIALRPAVPRTASRLLVSENGQMSHHQFDDILGLLGPNDRLVLNDTKVIPSRMMGERIRYSHQGETRAKIEVTLISFDPNGDWLALAKPAKRVKENEEIEFGPGFSARVTKKTDEGLKLSFNLKGHDFDKKLLEFGSLPLPPYIAKQRPTDASDETDYQTVFAKHNGAVAAPTASLHFDQELLKKLEGKGVNFTKVTLHVGAGTFLPVKTDKIDEHKMHSEWGEITPKAAAEIAQTRKSGGRVIAVGTTALRLIETAARTGEIEAFRGNTDIFIRPGFRFHVTDGLITNFHLPKSTLLMLVSALIGRDQCNAIYKEAILRRYRFFSYGDSSLLLP